MTFNSNCPACTAKDTVKSFPTTWNATMSRHSAITGLTLPAIIDEPGCTGGSTISPKPVVGPDASNRKSFATLISSKANSLSPLETACTALLLWSASKEFLAAFNGNSVIFPSSLIAARLNRGCAFAPVPTAVPPSATS